MGVETPLILSVSTNGGLHLKNFRSSLDKFGYEYKVLGEGETWKGWVWRTQLYLKEVNFLVSSGQGDKVVALVDATDLLFVQGPKEFLEKFSKLSSEGKVVIGAESACCTGEFDRNKDLKKQILVHAKDKVPNSRYRFANGGAVIGRAKDLQNLLEKNKTEEDDQVGYMKLWFTSKSGAVNLDTKQELVANLPPQGTNVYSHLPGHSSDLDYWSLDKEKGIEHNEYGSKPVIFHFPGKNWTAYNKVGELVLGKDFSKVPEQPMIIKVQQTTTSSLFSTRNLIILITLVVLMIFFLVLRRRGLFLLTLVVLITLIVLILLGII